MKRLPFFVVAVMVVSAGSALSQLQYTADTAAVTAIKEEALERSQVMDILSYLTDVYGPRLTWSKEYKEAADWTASKLREWGLQNVHYENWAPRGKGWTLKSFSAQAISPRAFPFIACPKAWSTGTDGDVEGEVVRLKAGNESELGQYKGKLKDAIVFIDAPRPLRAHFQADATRRTDSVLVRLANAGISKGGMMPDSTQMMYYVRMMQWSAKKLAFCQAEGAAVVASNASGDDGTVFMEEASSGYVPQGLSDLFNPAASAYGESAPKIVPQISIAAEHYNRITRMVDKGEKVRVRVNLEANITKADSAFNIIAEIPGSDLKDEIVMIGGHFDSPHGGTGATDNATGSAVCLEAARIIQKLGLKPRRTIRIGLWAGEEQGLLGSRAYVGRHFAEQESDFFSVMLGRGGPISKKADFERLSVYFNNDNGTGKVRGVYMQGNEAARPIFREWLANFNDPTAQTLTLSNTSGTDHLSFDGVGLPGFQFIQDPIDYNTRTHHSNMDVWDRAQEADLKQASAIMAVFAYNAAMMSERFPRK
jgi:carboxypeptidase Q